jgi:t-SNARE complex subunit (syntaxin)
VNIEDQVISCLEAVGIDGIDEDDLVDDEAFDEAGTKATTAAVAALRAAGRIDDLGCYGIRLSLAEWCQVIVDVVDAGGDA